MSPIYANYFLKQHKLYTVQDRIYVYYHGYYKLVDDEYIRTLILKDFQYDYKVSWRNEALEIIKDMTFMSYDDFVKTFECKTLELPDKNNAVNVSRIPPGVYRCTIDESPKFGVCIYVHDVPGRTLIRIHAGNFYTDLNGCIAVGLYFKHINDDKNIDLAMSKKTLNNLLEQLHYEFNLHIFEVC